MPVGLLVTVPLPEPVLLTERVRVSGGAPAVLTENERRAELVGFAAVCDWFVTTSTREVQPTGLNPASVLDAPLPATVGSGFSCRPLPVSHATVPRSCPPAEVLLSVTLYELALEGSATQASA